MLKSRWFDQVDAACPLPEYPRPQLRRDDWLCLNGQWEYAITPIGADIPQTFDGLITVPFAIESQLSGVCRRLEPNEWLWYRRNVSIPHSFSGKRILLHFGAVDWQCTVYVNGEFVVSHTGGYTSFYADITDFLTDGENTIVLQVYDPTDAGGQDRGKQSLESHGFWYTGTSGIWQTVWLEPVGDTYVKKLHLMPDIDAGILNISAELSSPADVFIRISAQKTIVWEGALPSQKYVYIPNAHLWSPEDPFLYDLEVQVNLNGETVDTIYSYFGMRKFSLGKTGRITRLFLNNKPYFQRGLLDQGYYCDGGLTPPTDTAMIYDIQKMKDLGFNMLRKHIKVDLARWYYHCDRLGMLVWQDMVSGGQWIGDFFAGVVPNILGAYPKLTAKIIPDNVHYARFSREDPAMRAAYEIELRETIAALENCVSIYCWVPFNEGWGQFDALRICELVRTLDPSRVIDHASGWYDQGGGDIQSMHKYILPIPPVRPDQRAFVITEFGGYSQVLDGHVWNKGKSFGYMMFRSKDSLTRAYRRLMEKQIFPIIPRYLSGFVYTQLSDVEFEVNGILSYDRKVVKLDEETVRALNHKMCYKNS